MSLTVKDYKNVLDIVGDVYSIPDPNAMFRVVCEKLQRLSIIFSAVFMPVDPFTKELYVNGYEVFNNHEGGVPLYLDHYAKLDPYVTSGWWHRKEGENNVTQNTEIVPERSFVNSEFAYDFLRSQESIFYVLGTTLVCQGDKVGMCGFHRQKQTGQFTEHHKEFINLLLPHMARALRNLYLIQKQNQELSREPPGVIAVGKDGNAIHINETAKWALQGAPIKTVPDPGLGTSPAFFKSRSGTFRVRTMPASGGGNIKVILLEQEPAEYRLYSKLIDFNLSRRQKEIVVRVIQGQSNGEIAHSLCIGEQTVKDHLHDVFGKLGISRRSQLANMVLNIAEHRSH